MSNRLIKCPHCGYDPSTITEWDFSEWKIITQYGSIVLKSELQARIFDLLWRRQGIKGLTRQRIIEIVYMNDLNGGSENASLTRVVGRIREQIESVGIHLKRGSTGGDGYSLIFVTPDLARNMNVKQVKGLGCKGVSKPVKARKTDGLEPVWMTRRKEG